MQETAQRQSRRFQLHVNHLCCRPEHVPSQLLLQIPLEAVDETPVTVVYNGADFVNKIAFVLHLILRSLVRGLVTLENLSSRI